MKVTAYLAFVAMYYALDAAWDDGAKDDKLSNYLSTIDPFLWKGIGSADPAAYVDFKKEYESKLGETAAAEAAYLFVCERLQQADPKFVQVFTSTVDAESWKEGLPEIEKQIEERNARQMSGEE